MYAFAVLDIDRGIVTMRVTHSASNRCTFSWPTGLAFARS